MRYYSTRDKSVSLSGAEAILLGLSRDGGLLVPETIPVLTKSDMNALFNMKYPERSGYIMSMFLDDFTREELTGFAKEAYEKFDNGEAAPVTAHDITSQENTPLLELFHGPTSAFKDIALQMLPRLLTASLQKTGEPRNVCILVATSGDTGKAALEGFADVPRSKIMVFYPRDGVSDVQKLQMMTQEGGNVGVCSVLGNFDDTQSGVKKVFSDENFRAEIDKNGYFLSSANSINWGRLLPQIVYYVSAYCDLVNSGSVKHGDEINFCVPTGNFGNILAGYYARKMGIPIKHLICASNRNDVLTEFINTGVYNRNREFFATASPSMDILISSNLERLLFDISGCDDGLTAGYMNALNSDGKYEVSEELRNNIRSIFKSGSCDDEKTKLMIGRVFEKSRYLLDTHTAVACKVLEDYRAASGDNTLTVVVATASPFKFADSVLEALGESADGTGLELIDRLEKAGNISAPMPLKLLREKKIRFEGSVAGDKMLETVREFLK